MRRVVVTGLGAITPLGVGVDLTWRRLLAGRSGIVGLPGPTRALSPSPSSSSSPSPPRREHPAAAAAAAAAARWRELPSRVAGLVPVTGPGGGRADGCWRASDWLGGGRHEERRMARFAQFAVAATEMALADARWRPETQAEREATGVCLGSGIGNFDEVYDSSVAYEKGGYKKVSPLFVPQLLINLGAGHIAMKYGLQGPNHAVTTACTTGAHSIGDAGRFIAAGDADVMIAGASESCIHPLALAGFARSRALSTARNDAPARASRPFDRDRDGFVVGEGAGILVLEDAAHARARGAAVYAELVGYGCSGDAYHMTAPREDGSGALLAMRRALRRGNVAPRDVDYINAHATSTPLGDAVENAAIRALMMRSDGNPLGVESSADVTVSSTKGAIGHLLGAAGAVEAIFSILAIREGVVPPTINLENLDESFDFNYVPNKAQNRNVNIAMSNSFGFGGTNASLVFKRHLDRS